MARVSDTDAVARISTNAALQHELERIATIGPTQLRKPLGEPEEPAPSLRVAFIATHEHADPPHAAGLLRPRSQRQRRRAPEPRDELPTPHSITSSARSKTDCGTVSPSALAVLRLTTISNFVGS
jgi:hypothetical protein